MKSMKRFKMCERFDPCFNSDEFGDIYLLPDGSTVDFSKLLVSNVAVDTVRQMYSGSLDNASFQVLKMLCAAESPILDTQLLASSSSSLYRNLKLPCDDLQLSRLGKASGYRLKLQNNEVGVVILLGSYYGQLVEDRNHLKIELSPHFIASRTPEAVQAFLDKIADCFMTEFSACGVAVHMCVDMQGWFIPNNFVENVVSRSRFVKEYSGIGQVHAENLDSLATIFNRKETITIGKSTSLQLCVYRKDLEIVKRDTVDYYNEKWGKYTLGEHVPSAETVRFEYRYHHSVIKQFGDSVRKNLTSFLDVHMYLDNLWSYALQTIALRCSCDRKYINPIWQYLFQNVSFNDELGVLQDTFKRSYKAKVSTDPIKRNIAMLMGNLTSIHARTARKFKFIMQDIINSPAIIDPLRLYFSDNGIDESIYFQHLERKILERRVASKFGVFA